MAEARNSHASSSGREKAPAGATHETEQLLLTLSAATGEIVRVEKLDPGGKRHELSDGEYAELAVKKEPDNPFAHMVVSMIAIGEESGALDAMLFKVAEFYEEEVSNAVDSLSSLLEPMIMVIIGILVGSMVIGMYLPIFKLAAAV